MSRLEGPIKINSLSADNQIQSYASQLPPIITILTCGRWKGLRCHVLWLLGGPNRRRIPCRVRGGCPPEGCLVG